MNTLSIAEYIVYVYEYIMDWSALQLLFKTPGLGPSLQQTPGMKGSMLPNYQDIVYNALFHYMTYMETP